MKRIFAAKVACLSIAVPALPLLAFPDAGVAQTTEILFNGGECSVLLDDAAAVEINPGNDGNVEATTFDPDFCSATDTTAEVTVSPLNLPLETPQGSSFTVNLSSLGARECRRLGLAGTNWPSDWISPPPDGSFDVEIPADFPASGVPETLTYECRNGDLDGQASDEVTVTESDDGGDLFTCTDLRPDSWQRDNRILVNSSAITETWQDVFQGVAFPDGNWRNVVIPRRRYAALAFDPAGVSAGDRGAVDSQLVQGFSVPFGKALISISPCPGDFRPAVLGACLQEADKVSSFRWSVGSEPSRCELPDAETLYFNIAYGTIAPDNSAVSWRCTSSPPTDQPDECGSRIDPQRQ